MTVEEPLYAFIAIIISVKSIILKFYETIEISNNPAHISKGFEKKS